MTDASQTTSKRASEGEGRLERLLGWLIGIRLVAITSIILPFLLAPEQRIYDYLLQGTGAVYIASLAYLVMLVRHRPSIAAQAYIQFTGDLFFITGLVYYSGGIASPISILYLIVISVASVFSHRRAGIIVATVGWLLYALVATAIFFGWVDSPSGADVGTAGRLVYHLAVHLFGFYAVAFLTSYLARSVAQAEQALEAKRELLADLEIAHNDVLESIPSGLLTTDLEGRIISANQAAEQILGKTGSELIGSALTDLGFVADLDHRRSALPGAHGIRPRLDAEYRRGEELLHIGYSSSSLKRADGSTAGALVIFQDLSQWRKLQEELRRTDRMAAVGSMAAGLAHEIGNPLAAISGSVQMLSASVHEDSGQSRLLRIILKESERLDRTIKGFLEFARPEEGSRIRFDIAALLSENVALLRNSQEVGPDHRIVLDLESNRFEIVGNRDQVVQIFWNLARNSLRAMESGGTLTVSGRTDAGSYRMSFSDTGRGMQEDERTNLFHPFRSFFDQGSGLGMAIVYRIVEEHNGELDVESAPGKGTTITIDLPVTDSVSTTVTAGN
jgi:two-component system sensor histidine kinase PilS (NtrC family)